MASNVISNGTLDPNILPPELMMVPQPLVGLFGLDVQGNPIHKTIWDAFSSNRKLERIGLNFKLLPFGTEFPVSKPKTRSYEWYHPKGILKRNWLVKHLNILPSVVVLFQNLEWADPQWTEKQLQCASNVQSIKNSLQGRSTQLIVVLIQKGSPAVPGDDLLSSERAANLTSQCDINAKMLFVLPYMDQHLMNYILRLESAFHEHSMIYYTQMAKQIRSHRDQLTSSHQGLMVRHQFKLGIISELKQDFNTALKHFKQGYGFLDEIRIVDTNCMEIKTVAGFFNFKICRLMFKLNMPRDSITHFKTHIEKYKSRAGFRELQFEHYAWLSVQYNAFAELFCEAIRNGLPALQTQHPGKYYYKAAEYTGKRKEAYLECIALPQSPVDTQALTGNGTSSLHSEFWGIRGTKSGETTTESIIIRLIQEKEKTFDHSGTIITILGQAMAQYKVYKCLRFRKKLAVDMAEEYLKCGQYSKALTLYSLMLADYRADKWYTIFTEILLKTLRSAYLSASAVDYITCSIEALSPHILIQKEERVEILENVWKVFQNVPPVSQQQLVPELKSKWEASLSTLKSPVLIDLDKITNIIDCKITFNKSQIKCNESYELYLFVRSNTDVPLKIKKFAAVLWDSRSFFKLHAVQAGEYTKRWETLRPFHHDLILEPSKCYKLIFQGDQTQLTENIELQIVKVEMEMGSEHNFALLTQTTTLNRKKPFKDNFLQRDCMELINVIGSCYVTPTFHLVSNTKQQYQPMLVNEYFQLQINIINNFDLCLQSVGISLTIPSQLRNRVFLTSDLSKGSMQKLSSHIQIDIGDLQLQSKTTVTCYLISLVEGNIELKQKLWYQTDGPQPAVSTQSQLSVLESPTSGNEIHMKNLKELSKNSLLSSHNIKIEYLESGAVKKIKEDTIALNCSEEFSFIARFYTLSRQALMRAYRNEDFLLRINVDVKSAAEIEIMDLYLLSDHNLKEMWHKNITKLLKRKYKRGNRLEDILILRPNRCSSEWLTKDDYVNNKSSDIHSFNKPLNQSKDQLGIASTLQNAKDSMENFSKNLLTDGTSVPTKTKSLADPVGKIEELGSSGAKHILVSKTIYNNAIDSLYKTQNAKNGFINHEKGLMTTNNKNRLLFGVYCVRWKRTDSNRINESKFMISGVDIIDPPLNIYCYFEQKIYVNIPVTFKITLKNPTTKVIHLTSTLNSSNSFMFSGHRHLNISLFSHSSHDLVFNLYPLKAGWVLLPELQLEYNQNQSDTPEVLVSETQQNELANLVKRWMPKWVFVHPPSMSLSESS